MIFYVHVQKLQLNETAIWLHDCVIAFWIWWVVVWVGWWRKQSIWGWEIASTCSNSECPLWHIWGLISKLKPKATSSIVGREPDNERKSCNINYFMLLIPWFTWFSSCFEWCAWMQGYGCHFHKIVPSEVNLQNFRPLTQWNLMVFLDNLYPLRGWLCWHIFHWAEKWGECKVPHLDTYLGMMVMLGLRLH